MTTTPTLQTCPKCDRALRPRGATKAEHPDTVHQGAHGFCATCYAKEKLSGRLEKTEAERRYVDPCARCGVETGQRRNPICKDCRYVLSTAEAEAWAA